MEVSSALLWLTSAALGVGLSSAQGETKYIEVGTTLSLEPDLSAIPKPVKSIRWKYGPDLVVDWPPENPIYYGKFRGRTMLDPQTLRLDINSLTLADSGTFILETDRGTFGTHKVEVIKPPPKPSMKTQPLVCEVSCTQCALKCALESVTDLGPVTYEWMKDGGEWTEGDVLKNMAVCETPEVFSCRVINPLRPSEGSDPKDNPCFVPPTPVPVVVKVLIVIVVLLVVVCAALLVMVFTCPEHPFSKRVQKWIPCKKQAVGASEAPNGGKADQPNGAVPLLSPPSEVEPLNSSVEMDKRNGENE